MLSDGIGWTKLVKRQTRSSDADTMDPEPSSSLWFLNTMSALCDLYKETKNKPLANRYQSQSKNKTK